MPIPHARRMNLIALALFITALVAFVAFHLLPGFVYYAGEVLPGWAIWTNLHDIVIVVSYDPLEMIEIASFLTTTLLVLACPFFVGLLRRSRIVWWIATLCSGSALFGLTGLLVFIFSVSQTGVLFIAIAQTLNFLGLLFIRREPAADLP